ncbi:GLPGLI family protein [Aequorivita sp. 609]|uniref:GLPGLI family protein n=1 Tax=Aequorivita TaxID=153265 RepID=UPI00161B2311|nr:MULTISPECIES: GLPGLI family protein [Aequorivita]MBB6680033.1 GLPGLI family protein [Aequorivita sp. 609]
MKYFLLFFLIVSVSYAQTGKIVYSSVLNFGGGQVNKTKNNLFFTKDASIYLPQLKRNNKTEKDQNTKEDAGNNRNVEINIKVGTDEIGNLYYNNLHSRTITCREPIYNNSVLKYYLYDDNASIKWVLLDEFKGISGYNCQKATTTFRGRNYEAWFTSEIPLSFGPWKFSGLPGLILEVYDLTGEVYFSSEHIQIPFKNAESKVQKPSVDTILEYREFIEKSNKASSTVIQAMRARLPKGAKLVSSEIKRNGIELEYEWDTE